MLRNLRSVAAASLAVGCIPFAMSFGSARADATTHRAKVVEPVTTTTPSTAAKPTTTTAAPRPPLVRMLPFKGTFRVSATWGSATGPTHPTPAIDFVMPIGTPVYATATGSVDFTSTDPRNCNPLTHIPPGGTYEQAIQWCVDHGMVGTRIRIRHDDGTYTMYVHLSAIRSGISAKPMSRVIAGELIGWSGDSGIATGPHLHFSKTDAVGKTYDPVLLRACWDNAIHDFVNLKALVGTMVRNDGYGCLTTPKK